MHLNRVHAILKCQRKLSVSIQYSHSVSSVAQSCPTLYDPMNHSMPGFPVHHQLLSCPSSWWSHPPVSSSVVSFSSCLQSFPVLRAFSNESALHIRWPKYWSFSFSFSINPSNEYSGLISLRIDWFDLLVVQGTLKSLLQHHNSKASILKFSWKLTWVLKVGLFPQHFLHSHCGPFTVMLFSPVFTGLGSWVLTIRQLAWGSCP